MFEVTRSFLRCVSGLLPRLLLLALAVAPFAQAANERWEQLGPPEGYIRGISSVSVAGGNVDTIFATTWGGGVVRSTWNGFQWTPFVPDNAGLSGPSLRVWGNAFNTASGLYIGTDGGGVWKATTAGGGALSWSQVGTGLGCLNVRNLTTTSTTLFASTTCPDDKGGVWFLTGGPNYSGTWQKAGTIGTGIGIEGKNTATLSTTTGCVFCLYATTANGLYYTTNAASPSAAWTAVVTPTNSDSQSDVIGMRTATIGGTVFAVVGISGNGIWKASIGSTASNPARTAPTWVQASGLPTGNIVAGVTSDPLLNNVDGWAFIQGAGAWKSSAGSSLFVNFTYVTGTERLPQMRTITRPTPEPNGSGNMLIAYGPAGAFWTNPNDTLGRWWPIDFDNGTVHTVSSPVGAIVFDPVDPAVFYVATGASVFRVGDKTGRNAFQIPLQSAGELGRDGGAGQLAVSHTIGQDMATVYVSTVGNGIFRTDCGSSECWGTAGTASGPSFPGGASSLPSIANQAFSLVLDPNTSNPQALYAFDDRRFIGESIGRGIWKSTSQGQSWSNFSGALGTIGGSIIAQKHITAAAISSDNKVIIGTRGGVYISSTASAGWSLLFALPTPTLTGAEISVRDIQVDGTNVYIAISGIDSVNNVDPASGIYTGTTSACCTKNATFPAGVRPRSLAITHAGGTTTTWVGTRDSATGGVYKSSDGGTIGTAAGGGVTWQVTNLKLGNKDVQTFGVFQPSAGKQMVAAVGTIGGGVYLRAIQEGPDYNNDGFADILWRNVAGGSAGQNYMWLMNSLNVQSGSGYLPTLDTGWVVAGHGDFDGDGNSDILLHHSSGLNYIWFMQGSTIVNQGYLPTLDSSWTVTGVGDFNGDGKSDVLLRHSSGLSYIWMLDGLTVLGSSGSLPTLDPAQWSVKGIGDFNGDGKSDVLLQHTAGYNYAWFLNGTTVLGSSGFMPSIDLSQWQIGGIGDIDGDGMSDIVLRHNSAGYNYVWFMNGLTVNGSSGFLPTVPNGPWTIAGLGDNNGDFMSDILWHNTSTGENYLWLLNGLTVQSVCGAAACQGGYLPAMTDINWQVQK